MDCAEAKLQIESYVAGELAADQKGPLEEHLATCAECRLDSELTRASRNQPAASSPPPALAPSGSEGSWSLDSIFGSDGSGGAGSATARPVTEPGADPPSNSVPQNTEKGSDEKDSDFSALAERAAAAAAPLPDHGMPDRSDEPPASDAPTWDFEPADVKAGAKPPPGSLFFAEEALSRSGAKKKSGVPRIVLWGAGALLGVGLLALSVWIAMTVRQPLPGSVSQAPIRAAAGPGEPGSNGAVPPPDANPAGDSVAEAEAPSPPAPSEPPATEVSEAPQATSAPTPTPKAANTPHPPAQEASRTAPAVKPPTSTKRPAVASPLVPKKPAASKPVTTRVALPKTAPPAPAASSTVIGDAEAPGRPPAASHPADPGSGTTSSKVAVVPPAVVADATPTPSSAEPSASAPAPPASSDVVERPVDRLHLATLNAEQNADLVSLRKLRETWRGFVKGSLGPERSRAKRELADCLWAIQMLTSKSSDQKEALVAFRDYVLNAPAGGADARTVARMRQLEDAVAESR